MSPTLTVRYSCHTCGLTKASCVVSARGEEDVTAWMEAVVLKLAEDHRRRSPGCVPIDGQLHDLLIPIEDPTKIGGARKQ